MLQEHLGRPLAIYGGKLLLCLNPVAANCEKLTFLGLLYDVCQSRYTVRRTAALRRCACIGLGLKGFVFGCQTGYVGLCLLHGLLDRCVAVKLALLHAFNRPASVLCRLADRTATSAGLCDWLSYLLINA